MKYIPGFGGRYKATRGGYIYSVARKIILTGRPNHNGYLRVQLRDDSGRIKNWMVHQLILMTYHGPALGRETNHLDCDKQNNHPNNLEWVSHKENMEHASQNGRLEACSRHMTALNVSRAVKVLGYDKNGNLTWALPSLRYAERHGFQHSEISRCLAGKSKTHKGFIWVRANA